MAQKNNTRDRPNFVLIMADDLGYSDIGCFGGTINTPHIDRLATKGLKYTQFYNCARCCPARASLLTGLYPHQAGMGWMTRLNLGPDGYVGDLNKNCQTMAEVLKPAGYSTYLSGKWHLTYDEFTRGDGPRDSWPTRRGFDRYFGSISGGGNYFTMPGVRLDNEPYQRSPKFYYTDAISEYACTFVDDHCRDKKGDPFFMYVAYTAPHWPLHAKPRDIAKYRGAFKKGWDKLRHEKYETMKGLKILDDGWGLSGRDEGVPAWDELPKDKKDEFDLRMAIYAAQIDCLDQGVGKIMRCLGKNKISDNTLVLFLSDNGGCHEEIHRGNPDPAAFGTAESFESYGRPWANLSNTPFREFKSWVHEGGIATPLIAHWPRGLNRKGEMDLQLGHITDIMPTFIELAGAQYPANNAPGIHALVGKSLVPGFSGKNIGRDLVFWEHEGNRALRLGTWKLVAKGVKGQWELYDMDTDRSEQHNLAGQDKDRVKGMASLWHEIASTTSVYPLDGRGWGERVKDIEG